MSLSQKHIPVRLFAWAVVGAALIALFRFAAPTEAEASFDGTHTIRLLTADGTIETMTLAEYLPGAVAAEMPASFGAEALKAQAVAARSYVLASHRHDGADICADSGCCLAFWRPDELRARWGDGYADAIALIRAAVLATDGEVLTYDGKIIPAVFHAGSVGATEDAAAVWSEIPYLKSVPTPETAETVPQLLSTAYFTPDELCARLGLTPEGAPDTWLVGVQHDDAGRVALLRIGGQSLSGTFVRSALELRSTAFDVKWDGARFVFTVAGYGHGVGMSQYGAMLLAEQGMDYAAILAHYYPGTELVSPRLQAQLPSPSARRHSPSEPFSGRVRVSLV